MKDRTFFESVYFSDPDGLVFELATVGSGFGVDEDEPGSTEIDPFEGGEPEMEVDIDGLDSAYRLLAGSVVPRPIAWVSSRSPEGRDNLAPYSFFNVVAVDPPVVMFAPVGIGEDLKDTPRNVLDTEEFVINVVTMELAEAMNATSATVEGNEFDHAALERAESVRVTPPRVADAKVAFECELYDFVEVGGSSMVLGRVVYAHVDDEVTTGGKVDVTKLDAVGRLSGSYYASTRDRFSMERPP